jgi:hypothetical protein
LFVKSGGEYYNRIENNLSKYKAEYPNCFVGVNYCISSDDEDIDFTADFKFLNHWEKEDINYIKLFKLSAGVDNAQYDKLQFLYEGKSLFKFAISK